MPRERWIVAPLLLALPLLAGCKACNEEALEPQGGAEASASGKALGFWRGEDAVPFAKRLLDRKRLLIQVTPLGARPVLAEFLLEGFDSASVPLREACSW